MATQQNLYPIDKTTLAYLVANEINMLITFEEGVRCCPHECGPCLALWRLHDSGDLDLILDEYGPGYDWWDDDKKQVRWEMITSRWCTIETCDALGFAVFDSEARSREDAQKFWEDLERRR